MADLIGDDTPVAFFPHRDLPPVTVKLLRRQYDDYLCAGDSRRATELSHLIASDEAGDIAFELNKSNRNPENKWKYFHPTIWAGVWRVTTRGIGGPIGSSAPIGRSGGSLPSAAAARTASRHDLSLAHAASASRS